MSIIEKALDKRKNRGPAERQEEDADTASNVATSRTIELLSAPAGTKQVAIDADPESGTEAVDPAEILLAQRIPGPGHTLIPAAAQFSEANARAAEPKGCKQNQRVEIDFAGLRARGMVTPDSGKTVIAEEFRAVKRALLEAAAQPLKGRKAFGNLIMVTSSQPKEGKTFTAINLAMSIAMEVDHTVLLVDADVTRPSIPRYLNLPQEQVERGLIDLLRDPQLDMSDVMLDTNVERLRILPSGKGHLRTTELLTSQAMRRLLEGIALRYPDRIIIFDSPPVLYTSEARALADRMGQIVLVVEAGSTTQATLKETLRKLGADERVSLVYNKASALTGSQYYAEYY